MEKDSARGAIQPGVKILARYAQTGLGFSARPNGLKNHSPVCGISLTDKDIANRVPTRRRSDKDATNEAIRPSPVICKFTRRIAKVIAKRKEVANVKYKDIGLDSDDVINHLAVYEHLTPRLQELLFEAKKFQRSQKYEFYWAKGSTIFLRASSESRIIKLRSRRD